MSYIIVLLYTFLLSVFNTFAIMERWVGEFVAVDVSALRGGWGGGR